MTNFWFVYLRSAQILLSTSSTNLVKKNLATEMYFVGYFESFSTLCIFQTGPINTLCLKKKNVINFLSVFLPPSSLSIVLGSALRNPKS